MTLVEFITKYGADSSELKTYSVFWIRDSSASSFFCSILFKRVATFIGQRLESVDCQTCSLEEVLARCGTSFLGQFKFYAIKNAESFSAGELDTIEDYFFRYRGSHTIGYISERAPEGAQESVLVIDVHETKVTEQLYRSLYFFLSGKHADRYFCSMIFKHFKQISLDRACLLMSYQELLGQRSELFFERWLERLWQPEHSLFTLSKLFFAKDVPSFLMSWSRMVQLYPEEFWITYWSEQLWQALLFVYSMNSGIKTAPQSYRLPFSFVQQDWRNYSDQELSRAQAFLYTVDHRFKQGMANGGIDLFCVKFLTHGFKQAGQ